MEAISRTWHASENLRSIHDEHGAGLAGDSIERAERPRRLFRHFRVRINVHRPPKAPISQGQLGTFLGLSQSNYISVLNDTGFYSTITWDHEDLQRNAMFDQVFPNLSGEQQASPGDVILVSDIDEVPRPATLQVLRNCKYPRRLTLRSRFYYYSFQWLHRGAEWPHPQATIYEGDKTIRPANLRNGEGGNIIRMQLDKADLWNAAWHCSFCFATLDGMVNKISSFSHTRLNQPEFRDPEGVVRRVRNGLDLFDRKEEYYDRIESNADIPEYTKTHKEQFSYMLDRDPPNANFRDYTVNKESGGEPVAVS